MGRIKIVSKTSKFGGEYLDVLDADTGESIHNVIEVHIDCVGGNAPVATIKLHSPELDLIAKT